MDQSPYRPDKKGPGIGCLIGVIIAIVVLTLLAVPGGTGGHGNARVLQARAAASGLIIAIKGFQTEYNQLPLLKGYADAETIPITSSGSLLNVLMAENSDINSRKIKFYDPPPAKKNANGFLEKDGKPTTLDPWGQPYYLLLDLNHDGKIPDPEHPGMMIDMMVLVFSGGSDGNPATWQDNVKSWVIGHHL